MGLDISYYRLGKKVEVDDSIERHSDEWYEKYGDLLSLYDSGWDQADDLEEGSYEGEYLDGFRAGSYSGYSWFRNTLRDLAGIALSESKELQEKYGNNASEPFESLTHFSDCEGYIGPFTSAELAEVFNDFEKPIVYDLIKMSKYGVRKDVYSKYSKDDLDYFATKYQDWKKAFNEVAGNGVVIFH